MGSAGKGDRAWSPMSLCFLCKCVRNILLAKRPSSHDQWYKHCLSLGRFKISSQIARDSVRGQQNSFCTALTLHDSQISVCPLHSHYFRDMTISDPENSHQGVSRSSQPCLKGVSFIRSILLNKMHYHQGQLYLLVNFTLPCTGFGTFIS